MADFIPAGDDARKTWAITFKSKIATHGAAVGLTSAQVTAAQAKCDVVIGRIDDKTAKKNAWQSSVTAADSRNATDFGDLRNTIVGIKTNTGYTDAIGADLGVIGSAEVRREKPHASTDSIVTALHSCAKTLPSNHPRQRIMSAC